MIKKQINLVIGLSIFLLSLIFITPSYAALVLTDDSYWGADAIILDTETGLEWLNTLNSVSDTRDYINTQFGSGGEFEGFRYATLEEVEELFEAVGIQAGDGQTGQDIFDAVEYMATLVGAVRSQGGNPEILAQIGTGEVWGTDYQWGDSYNIGVYMTMDGDDTYFPSWLVRDNTPVPIPGAAWLLGSGLLGIIGIRRRSRN